MLRALSLLLLVACGTAAADCRTMREGQRGGRGRGGQCAGSSAAGFDAGTPSLLYSYPFAAAAPTCTAAENCVALFSVGARTGSTTAWESVGPTGAAVGTVTDPGTATIINSNVPNLKAIEISSGAVAPSVVSTAVDALFGASTAHTVISAGFGRTTGAPSGFNYWFNQNSDATGQFIARQQSGNYNCIEYAITTSQASTANDGWNFNACRRNGGNDYYATVQGLTTPKNDVTPVVGVTGGQPYNFGTRAALDLYLNGPLQFVALYSDNKTDTWMEHQRARYDGSYSDAGVLTGGNPQYTGIDNMATTGNVDIMFPGSRLVDSSGLITATTFTNSWAADALAAATWTDVGTPTITSNVSSGPFSTWLNAAECDLIADDDGAAFEGKQGATAGTTAGYYNASCYLKAGTSGTTTTAARIAITVAGGTGSTDCDFTGLTSTASRQTCSALAAGGGITSVRASVLVGNTAAQTGSIQACQCQLTYTVGVEPPTTDNVAHGATYYTASAANWPDPSLGGKYEIVHTPTGNPLTQWSNANQSTYYILDVSDTGPDHTIALIFGYTVAGRVLAVVRNGVASSDITIDGIGLTPGQPYASATQWVPVGGGLCNIYVRHNACAGSVATCRAETIIGSDTTGTATCPGTPATLTLGNRYNAAVPTSGKVNAVRVYGP